MNAEDLSFILQEEYPHLLTEEEKEDMNYEPNSSPLPDMPHSYKAWFMRRRPNPEAMERREFEARPPALGITPAILDELVAFMNQSQLRPVQKRHLYSGLRDLMLRQLIPCSDCSTIAELIQILRAEMEGGMPAPVPDWYQYSTVTMGPRKIGYYDCCNRNCFKTEDTATRFQTCSQCHVAHYCSRECQKADWKAKHKFVCKKGAENRDKTASVGKMLQMLSDMSMSGQGLPGNSLADVLANASKNEAVKQRRADLEAEKSRPKK